MKNNKMLLLLTCAGLIAMQQTQAGWVDVTQKVKDLNGKSFTVDTATFGDPAPYHPKTLEITVIEKGNPMNIPSINENENVPAINGEITSATYGDANDKSAKWLDVTEQVKTYKGNSFKVGNDTLGISDPASGRKKLLTINYVPYGSKTPAHGQYEESQYVPTIKGEITSATYGDPNDESNKWMDVTAKVKTYKGNSFKVGNDTLLFSDPAFGREKTLKITYIPHTAKVTRYNEGAVVPAADRKFDSARYGTDDPIYGHKTLGQDCSNDSDCESNHCGGPGENHCRYPR